MSQYDSLWRTRGTRTEETFVLSFGQIEELLGFPIDHAFLTYKKEAGNYGLAVGKISMKNKTVDFVKREKT